MSKGLKPFFTYYGGKWRVAPKYPAPQCDRIFEPFGGSAGYSLRYPERNIWINDSDPVIAGTWAYLKSATPAEILALPDLEPGQTVNDLDVPQGARWLIGWWLNKGSAQPKLRPSSFMLNHSAGAPYWGPGIRERIAFQLPAISHWTITNYDYEELPANWQGTWFIDPPYERAGKYYRHGSDQIDFPRLGRWCEYVAQMGSQVIVCEADEASWLDFTDLAVIDGTEGRQKKVRARREVLWCRDAA